MAAILHALQGILTIVIMIATGFYLSRKGWFSESFSSAVAQLVTKVCLPTYMIVNLTVNFSHDQLIEMSGGLPVPIISMALGYFIGHAAARLLKVRRDRVGVFCTVFFVSNTIFIGLPMTLALFGEEGIPYVMLYYMVNTTMFWVVAVHDMASDAGVAAPWLSRKTLKVVLNPPLCVMVCLPFFALPKLMSDVFVMQAAMPAMTNTSIVAKVYGGDYKYAAMLTVVSTLLAVITTPFYMWVLRG